MPTAWSHPGDGLAHGVVGREGRELAGVEAVGVAGLGEELAGALGIVRRRVDRQGEVEVARHDAAGGPRQAERLGLVERLAVDGEAGGQPHALVGPGRLRIPLVREIEPEDAEERRHQAKPRRALDVLGGGPAQEKGDVDFSALERGGARGLVGQAPEDEPLDGRSLAPVALEGFEHQLDARVEAHELVGARADGRLAKALFTHALDVLPGHDPSGAGDEGAVESREIRPRLLEDEAHAIGRGRLDLLHRVLENLRSPAAVALEGELHVVGGDRISVMELGALPQGELGAERVLGHGPRLGQARGRPAPGHGLEQPVVERVEEEIGRDGALALRGIEPPRDGAEVHREGERALGRRPSV